MKYLHLQTLDFTSSVLNSSIPIVYTKKFRALFPSPSCLLRSIVSFVCSARLQLAAKMHLVPKELDKLVISQTGLLAQRRLARGVRLNHSEACVSMFSFHGVWWMKRKRVARIRKRGSGGGERMWKGLEEDMGGRWEGLGGFENRNGNGRRRRRSETEEREEREGWRKTGKAVIRE